MRCYRRHNCNGKSIVPDPEEDPEEVGDTEQAGDADPENAEPARALSGMTKAQLLDYATENGVSVNSRMTKAAIIEAIEGE